MEVFPQDIRWKVGEPVQNECHDHWRKQQHSIRECHDYQVQQDNISCVRPSTLDHWCHCDWMCSSRTSQTLDRLGKLWRSQLHRNKCSLHSFGNPDRILVSFCALRREISRRQEQRDESNALSAAQQSQFCDSWMCWCSPHPRRKLSRSHCFGSLSRWMDIFLKNYWEVEIENKNSVNL